MIEVVPLQKEGANAAVRNIETEKAKAKTAPNDLGVAAEVSQTKKVAKLLTRTISQGLVVMGMSRCRAVVIIIVGLV